MDEILEMAEQIERNASKFYKDAAKMASNGAMRKTFGDLSAMEEGHFRIFQEMRKQLSPEEKEQLTFDPDNQAVSFLQAMADSHGSEGKKGRTEKLSGKESIREIFEIAVNAEKDSVVFYTAIKGLVTPASGKDRIETIIDEELGHLAVLKLELARL